MNCSVRTRTLIAISNNVAIVESCLRLIRNLSNHVIPSLNSRDDYIPTDLFAQPLEH